MLTSDEGTTGLALRAPGTRSAARSRALPWAAAVLALAALVIPPEATLVALRGAPPPGDLHLLMGMWLFKGLLLVHAAALIAMYRNPLPHGGTPPVHLPSPGEEDRGAVAVWALAAILLVALVVRIPGLGSGLWYDEIDTLVSYIRAPLGTVVTTFDSKNQHMLFSVLASLSFGAFGESPWALRAPAMLFGVASVGALYWFGRLVAGRWEGLAAAGIMALSYHHVWFSQNARGYTGLLLWTLVGTGLLLRMLADTRPRGWGRPIGYGAVMALAMLTHATAIFVIAAHALIVAGAAIRQRDDLSAPTVVSPVVGLVLSGTITLQLHAVVLPQFLDTMLAPTMAGTQTEWQSPVWLVLEAVRGLQRGLPGGWLALAGGAAIGGAGLVGYWRSSRAITLAMLLPLVLTGAAIILMRHNLWPRFFFFGAGFALLIVVRGIFVACRLVLNSRYVVPAALGIAALLALANAAMLPRAWGPKQDYEGALSLVESERRPGDAVVVVDMTRLPYERYLPTDWLVADDLSELREIEERHSRTWVVYTFPVRLSAVQPAIWERLKTEYRTVKSLPGTVGSGEVVVVLKG